MAPRPTWQGHLRLSLVTCPVALYTAVKPSSEVSFHLINPDTGNRVRMIATDPDAGPVERSSLVRGYEFEKNRHVIVSDEEIERVKIESTRTIDIDRFVDASEIDRLYWNTPYFLVPDGKLAAEAYAVILKAMADSNRIALGRVVLHTRERLLALEARPPGIVATSLRAYNEVRKPEDFFDEIPHAKPDKGMVDIASKIVDQLSGPFEPEAFRDRYEDALRDLIQAKLKGKAPTITAPEPEDTPAKDLMDMLRKSLQQSASPRRSTATRSREAKPATKRRTAHAPARRASGGRKR
jgi:DNA end-binding protein Ku